jgi:hypothetical protein
MAHEDLSARYKGRWYKTDNEKPYISSDCIQWSPLLEPSSNAETVPIIRDGRRAFDGPFTWTSPPGSSSWSLSDIDFSKCNPDAPLPAQHEEPPQKNLYLITETQLPGEPQHWSLFVAAENEAGTVFQVTGDADKMVYQHLLETEKFVLYSYKTSYVLAEDIDDGLLEKIRIAAESVPPPEALSRREVRENCQGWAWKVVERLEKEDVVKKGKGEMVGKMVQPI